MKIHKIRLKNLNSLRTDIELDFDDGPLSQSGLFAITGDTGAGKTTILDAITLALFGQTSRDHDKEVMSNGATEAYAEVEFANEKGRFLARWSQKRTKSKDQPLKTHRELGRLDMTGDTWITVETGRRVDSTSKEKGAVETALGLNYEQFKRTVLLAQGEFAAFLKADEKDRAGVLERLTNTEEYSLLSRAAHLRALEERRTLEHLHVQRNAIAVLDDEQLAALEQNLHTHEQEAAGLDSRRRAARENLAWLDQLAALERQRASLATQEQALDTERAAFGPEQLRLDRHRQTAPFQPALARRRELETERAELTAALHDLMMRETVTLNEETQLARAVEEKRAALEQAELEAAETEKVLEKVIGLDGQIARQHTLVAMLQTEVDELQEKKDAIQARLDDAGHQHQLLEHEKNELRPWLERRGADAGLAADLPVLENVHLTRLRELRANLEKNTESLRSARTRHATVRAEHDRLVGAAEAGRRQLATEHAELDRYLGEFDLPGDIAAAQLELDRRVEAATAQLQSFEDFARYHGDYRRIARELGAVRDEQASLLAEDFSLGKELLTTLDLLDELRRKVALKQERYLNEQRKANYARDRSDLRAGDPCPLCGATEHPFTLHETAAAFVDDARHELHLAQKQLEAAEQQHTALVARHATLRDRIGDMHDGFDEVVSAQTRHLVGRMNEYEAKIVGVLPRVGVPAADFEAREMFFSEQIELLRAQLESFRSQRDAVSGTVRRRNELERARHEARQQESEQASALQILGEKITQLEELDQNWQEQLANEVQAVDRLLEPYGRGYTADDGEALEETVVDLRRRAEVFTERERRERAVRQRLEVLTAEIEQLQRAAAERAVELERKTAALNAENARLDAWRTERHALFGERNAQSERAVRTALVQSARQALTVAGQRHQELAATLTAVRSDRRQHENLAAQNALRLEQLHTTILRDLAQTGFADLEALFAAVLPAETADALERRSAQLAQRATELAQSRRDAERALDAERARALPVLDRAEAEARYQEAENAYQATQREIGSLQRQQAENDQRRRQAATLLGHIERQQREYDRWERLRALIGSHDGAAFRKFAQSLTLQQLIQHANRHLERLQGGRYRLHKKRGADLELEIIDRYQADFLRSVSTLSGGETFLASLALALGLADMANKKTRIQSLFIDEGFGALDENALELAITTLESLQAQGATIGIISHLRELKERISTQIQVVKKADGFSEVEIVS